MDPKRQERPEDAQPPSPAGLEAGLLVVGVAALGFNLRGAITSLPPVFPELQARLQLSSAELSLLAAAPVLCFGVVSAVAAPLGRKAGEERSLLLASLALAIGLLMRAIWPAAMLFPGTIVACAGIAVMNVLLGSLIKRRWPRRAGFLVGLYVTMLSLGAIAASVVSVPLYDSAGRSLPLTLGWLVVPAAVGVLVWLPQLSHGREASRSVPREEGSGAGGPASGGAVPGAPRPLAARGVWRQVLAWQVAAFMGMQSLLYYATVNWLPTIFRDRGVSAAGAGGLLGVLGVGNLALALVTPVLAQRMRGQHALVIPIVAGIAAGTAGALWAPPGSAVVWMLILGAAQNAALGVALYFMVARAPDASVAASLSAMSQSAGYLLASLGPLAVGLLHTETGGWSVPGAVMLVLTVALLAAGLLAARPRTLAAGGAAAGPLTGPAKDAGGARRPRDAGTDGSRR